MWKYKKDILSLYNLEEDNHQILIKTYGKFRSGRTRLLMEVRTKDTGELIGRHQGMTLNSKKTGKDYNVWHLKPFRPPTGKPRGRPRKTLNKDN